MLSGRRVDGSECPVAIALSSKDTGNGMRVIAAVGDMTVHFRGERDGVKLDRLAAALAHSADAIVSRTLGGKIASDSLPRSRRGADVFNGR